MASAIGKVAGIIKDPVYIQSIDWPGIHACLAFGGCAGTSVGQFGTRNIQHSDG